MEKILNHVKVKTILLVDWPNTDVPLTLLKSGYQVFSFSPKGYSEAISIGEKEDKLDFTVTDQPAHVDLVCIYRPAAEHAGIIKDHVIPLGAAIIWLQPPVESLETVKAANELGLLCISGNDIRDLQKYIPKPA